MWVSLVFRQGDLALFRWAEPRPRQKMGGRVTSLYADLFHRPKIGGTNQIAVFKWSNHIHFKRNHVRVFITMDVATVTSIASEAGRRLGYQSMKPEQVDVVVKILQGRDVFAILPTGFGKSLCYACLPSAFDILLKQESGHS